MADVTRTKVWSSGDTLTASDLNAEFNNLLNSLGLVNADVAAGAAIAYSKLNLTGGIVNADISASAAIAASKISDTAVTLTATQTLTNKTLTNPVVGGAGGTPRGTLGYTQATEALLIGDGSAAKSFYVAGWQDYTPTFAGFSSNPTVNARYGLFGRLCIYTVSTGSGGTSNAQTFTISAPVAAANSSALYHAIGVGVDNGVGTLAIVVTRANSATIDIYKSPSVGGNTWTASGNKYASFTLVYETT